MTLLFWNVFNVLFPHLFFFLFELNGAFKKLVDQHITNEWKGKQFGRLEAEIVDFLQ